MNATKAFKQFQPMIEGAAWKAHRHYHIDVEELRGQAYLVFCEAIERYDPNKASFSTHLFSRLRTVKDYASQERRKCQKETSFQAKEKREDNDVNVGLDYIGNGGTFGLCAGTDLIPEVRYEQVEEAMDRLETALDLSEDAQDILDFLIGREWETPGINRVPRLYTVKKYYRYWKGWMPQRTEKAWEEIRNWWLSRNHFLQEA